DSGGDTASGHQAYQPNEDTGTDKRHHDAADDAHRAGPERTHDQSAHKGADQPDYGIADDAEAAIAHHVTGEKAGDQTDHDPADDALRFEIHRCQDCHAAHVVCLLTPRRRYYVD